MKIYELKEAEESPFTHAVLSSFCAVITRSARIIKKMPFSRELSLAITKLEEAVMWLNAARDQIWFTMTPAEAEAFSEWSHANRPQGYEG